MKRRHRLLDPRLLDIARRMADMSPGAFRNIRMRRGLSGAEVADLTGLTRANLWSIEQSRRRVPDTLAGMRFAQWLCDPRNEP
jgi:DNA-binding transcriptional regulator YiaG